MPKTEVLKPPTQDLLPPSATTLDDQPAWLARMITRMDHMVGHVGYSDEKIDNLEVKTNAMFDEI